MLSVGKFNLTSSKVHVQLYSKPLLSPPNSKWVWQEQFSLFCLRIYIFVENSQPSFAHLEILKPVNSVDLWSFQKKKVPDVNYVNLTSWSHDDHVEQRGFVHGFWVGLEQIRSFMYNYRTVCLVCNYTAVCLVRFVLGESPVTRRDVRWSSYYNNFEACHCVASGDFENRFWSVEGHWHWHETAIIQMIEFRKFLKKYSREI